jgi:dihydrofolate reductase
VAELKGRPGKDIVVLGSGALLQTLMAHNLIDEYVLQIHPLVLGSGSRLFNDGPFASHRLVGTTTTTTGVVIATYQPAEAISAQTTAGAKPAVTSRSNTK